MSDVRRVDPLPECDDLPSAHPRELSYDFSRWNSGGNDPGPCDDGERDAPVVRSSPPEAGEVSFKVYTPGEIKLRPIRRTPLSSPGWEPGLRDGYGALHVARSFDPKGLVARFGIGAAAGAILLASVIGFAFAADDTPETRGILTAKTQVPSVAPPVSPMPTFRPALEAISEAVIELPAEGETYFELADNTPKRGLAKPARASRGGAGGGKRALVRESPF